SSASRSMRCCGGWSSGLIGSGGCDGAALLRLRKGKVAFEGTAYRIVFLQVDGCFTEAECVAAGVRQELARNERTGGPGGQTAGELAQGVRAQRVQCDRARSHARKPRKRVRQVGDLVSRAQQYRRVVVAGLTRFDDSRLDAVAAVLEHYEQTIGKRE